MKIHTLLGFASAVVVTGILAVTLPTYAKTYPLFSTIGFVDTLIAQHVISPEMEHRARSLARAFDNIRVKQNSNDVASGTYTPLNKDKVSVRVSQLIEYGTRTYNRFEDVRGLLLLVENTNNAPITLAANRKCKIWYRIYNENNDVLYDSSQEEACQNDEHVTYVLRAKQTRMFPVRHKQSAYQLSPGTYRFELEYPGYGKGALSVTVL